VQSAASPLQPESSRPPLVASPQPVVTSPQELLALPQPPAASPLALIASQNRQPGLADHYISVRSANNAFPANRHFFAEYKDLVRQRTPPAMRVTQLDPHTARVQLQAPPTAYVYFAHVTSPHESTRFSDNFVDLQPGETCTLEVTDLEHEIHPDTLRLAWA
jgi:hypothetical protein